MRLIVVVVIVITTSATVATAIMATNTSARNLLESAKYARKLMVLWHQFVAVAEDVEGEGGGGACRAKTGADVMNVKVAA
jgi:hypothetical protein